MKEGVDLLSPMSSTQRIFTFDLFLSGIKRLSPQSSVHLCQMADQSFFTPSGGDVQSVEDLRTNMTMNMVMMKKIMMMLQMMLVPMMI